MEESGSPPSLEYLHELSNDDVKAQLSRFKGCGACCAHHSERLRMLAPLPQSLAPLPAIADATPASWVVAAGAARPLSSAPPTSRATEVTGPTCWHCRPQDDLLCAHVCHEAS